MLFLINISIMTQECCMKANSVQSSILVVLVVCSETLIFRNLLGLSSNCEVGS